MGLKSLIAVAQGKNASNVSFEDKFIKEYQEAVKRQEERERQPVPKDYFRPSSMYGCDRMLFFMRVHCGGTGEKDKDTNLIEICNSGTDRHLRIQKLVEDMEGVEILDLEELVKEANQKGIKTEFVGWNEDHTEGRCKNAEMSIYFQPDGALRFMGKDVILEIKTESTYQHNNRYEPKVEHKYQATCYGMGLGIDYVLFFYEDRNFCGKKAYLWKITDEMKDTVLSKIARVNKAISVGVPPEKDTNKCTYCDYKHECKLADEGKWIDPRPKEPQKEPKKATKKASTGKSKGSSKKGQEKPKTEPTGANNKPVSKLCGKCAHCRAEGFGAYYCAIDTEGSMYVDKGKKCKFTPSRWEAGVDG